MISQRDSATARNEQIQRDSAERAPTARQRGTGSPQRDSAERATHSATARDEQLQRDSAERAALSMTVPIHTFGGWPENCCHPFGGCHYFKQLCSAEAMVNTVQTGQSTARQRGTGSPQRDSAERATHSATARNEQIQRDSMERAPTARQRGTSKPQRDSATARQRDSI